MAPMHGQGRESLLGSLGLSLRKVPSNPGQGAVEGRKPTTPDGFLPQGVGPSDPAQPFGDQEGTLSLPTPATWMWTCTAHAAPLKPGLDFRQKGNQQQAAGPAHPALRWGLPLPTIHGADGGEPPLGGRQCPCGQELFFSAPNSKRASLCPVRYEGSLSSLWE